MTIKFVEGPAVAKLRATVVEADNSLCFQAPDEKALLAEIDGLKNIARDAISDMLRSRENYDSLVDQNRNLIESNKSNKALYRQSQRELTFVKENNLFLQNENQRRNQSNKQKHERIVELESTVQSLRELLVKLPQDSPCIIDVGDGSGNKFVHGDHESIKAVQDIIRMNESLTENIKPRDNLINKQGDVIRKLKTQILKLKQGHGSHTYILNGFKLHGSEEAVNWFEQRFSDAVLLPVDDGDDFEIRGSLIDINLLTEYISRLQKDAAERIAVVRQQRDAALTKIQRVVDCNGHFLDAAEETTTEDGQRALNTLIHEGKNPFKTNITVSSAAARAIALYVKSLPPVMHKPFDEPLVKVGGKGVFTVLDEYLQGVSNSGMVKQLKNVQIPTNHLFALIAYVHSVQPDTEVRCDYSGDVSVAGGEHVMQTIKLNHVSGDMVICDEAVQSILKYTDDLKLRGNATQILLNDVRELIGAK